MQKLAHGIITSPSFKSYCSVFLSTVLKLLFSNHIDLISLERLAECSAQFFVAGPHGEPVLVEEQRWNDVKNSLKKQLLLVYSPVHPDKFLEYKLEGTNWTGNTSYGDYVRTGDVTHNFPAPVMHRRRLAEAIHGIGGIGVFLYLFAKVGLGIAKD
jgi:hypothetical protein